MRNRKTARPTLVAGDEDGSSSFLFPSAARPFRRRRVLTFRDESSPVQSSPALVVFSILCNFDSPSRAKQNRNVIPATPISTSTLVEADAAAVEQPHHDPAQHRCWLLGQYISTQPEISARACAMTKLTCDERCAFCFVQQTFLMGLNQGYRAGKAQGIKEATSPASQTDPASADSAIGGNTA